MDLSKRPDQSYAHTTVRRVGRCISSYLGMLIVGVSGFVLLSLDHAMAQFPMPLVKSGIYRSCKEILTRIPSATSGVYSIQPDYTATTSGYCNMTYDGGGWTLIASSNDTDNTGPVVTSLTSTTAAGVLSSTFVQPLANLVTEVAIAKGPMSDGFVFRSTSTNTLTRLRSYLILNDSGSMGLSPNPDWTPSSPNNMVFTCNPTYTLALSSSIYWACGNGSTGLHWNIGGVIKWGYSDATTSNLNLWVR